jgi:hypothetical protein
VVWDPAPRTRIRETFRGDISTMTSLTIFVIGSSNDLLHHISACVVNSTKTPDLILNFLKFFRRLYAPISDHVTPALIPAELPLQSAPRPQDISYPLPSVIAQSLLSCRSIVPSTFLPTTASMV